MILENFRLKVFRVVAEHLSFRKAGEALYLTQPAVTLQIKALEEELGTKLFERAPPASGLQKLAKFFFSTPGRCISLPMKPKTGWRL